MIKYPGFVPMLEAHEYAERLFVGNLGLPVGIEAERLEINVSAVMNSARWGNIDTLFIHGIQGDKTEYGYSVGSTDSNGTASVLGSKVLSKADIQSNKFFLESNMPDGYNWKKANVQINNAEIEQRITNDGDKWELGLFDINARAKYLDMALRRGLGKACIESIKKDMDPLYSLIIPISSVAVPEASNLIFTQSLSSNLPLYFAFSYGYITALRETIYHVRQKDKYQYHLPEHQKTAISFGYYDRLAMSQLRLRTSRLIRAV